MEIINSWISETLGLPVLLVYLFFAIFVFLVVSIKILIHQIDLLRGDKLTLQQETARLEKQLADKSGKSLNASRATIKGQIAEQLAPILPGFPFQPSEFSFLGQPIDYICYVGLTEAREGTGQIKEIVLGDIKQNTARLSPHQRQIKEAVERGRVRWQTIQIDSNFRVGGKR